MWVCVELAVYMHKITINTLVELQQKQRVAATLVHRPHGKASGLGTLLFQICSAVNEIPDVGMAICVKCMSSRSCLGRFSRFAISLH